MSKVPKNWNSELLKWSKWQFLELQNDKNWFHVKSGWQKNPENSTFCIPNKAALKLATLKVNSKHFEHVWQIHPNFAGQVKICDPPRDTNNIRPLWIWQDARSFFDPTHFFLHLIFPSLLPTVLHKTLFCKKPRREPNSCSRSTFASRPSVLFFVGN